MVTALVTVGAAMAAAFFSDGLLRWIALGAAVALAPDGWRVLPARLRQEVARWAPLGLVGVVAAVLLWELVLGRPPASRDHTIHYFQTSVLVEQMIPTGRLSGWTDRLNNGYPFGESYPTLGYLWVGAVHLLSFGTIGLRTSYAWGLLGVWMLAIASVWWLARTIAEEIGASGRHLAWASSIGALLWLLDPGGSRQGGWNYVMFHGVWPQMFSAALWTLSLVLTWRALRHPSPRRLAIGGGVLGASILAHPFGLLTAATSAAGWLAVLLLVPEGRSLASGRFRLWLAVHALAAGLAFGWVAVFFGSAESMSRSPVPWASLGELATDLVRGTLFDAQSMWAGALALIGIAIALWRGKLVSWLVLGLVVALIVLGSHAAITVLRLDLLASGFKNLQFPRYTIAIKPLLFALGGPGFVVLLRGFEQSLTDRASAGRPRALRFAAALVLAPLLAGIVEDAGRLVERPVGALDTLADGEEEEHEAELRAALRTEAETLGETPLRVAFLRTHMGGGMYPILAVTDASDALVLDGHIATVNFEHRFGPRTPRALAALGVTHVVFDRDLDDEKKLAAALREVGTYGPYTLSRLDPGEVERRPAMAARSSAELTVVEEQPERLVLDVADASERTAIILLRAPHVRWRASFDGAELDIDRSRLHRGLTVMKVVVPGPGRLVLTYHRSRFETVAAWTSAMLLLVMLSCLLLPRPFELADRLHASAAQRLSALLLGLSAALILVWLVRHQQTGLEETWHEAIGQTAPPRESGPSPELVRDLVIDASIEIERSPEQVCVGLLGKNVMSECSEAAHRASMGMLYRRPYLYRCLELTVPPKGTADVRLGPPGTSVIGMIERVDGRGRGRHLLWNARAKRRPLGNVQHDFHLRAEDFPEGVVLHLYNRGRLPERVCVAAAEVK